MSLRRQLFWFRDKLTRGKVKAAYTDIESIMSSSSNLVDHRLENNLKSLLKHAERSTTFYKGLDPTEFHSWPVINKGEMLKNQHGFESDRFSSADLRVVSTSGSTGIPFKVKQDQGKRIRQLADMLYFNDQSGHHFGDKLFYLRIWNDINSMSAITRWLKNIEQVDGADLSLDGTKRLLKSLDNCRRPCALLSYGSSIEAHAHNIKLLRNQLPELNFGNLRSIILMAEPVSKEARSTLKFFFGKPARARYSTSENGFIAHQMNDEDYYVINKASFKVELLEFDSNQPVEDGEEGRIVVTDLFNYATPMIRYDTGDVGIKKKVRVNGLFHEALVSISGRRMDFIESVKGELISPHVIDYSVRGIEGIRQFQLIQQDQKRYLLKLNSYIHIDEGEIFSSLRKYLGKGAEIEIEKVSEIPVLSSGKRKLVINNYKKT